MEDPGEASGDDPCAINPRYQGVRLCSGVLSRPWGLSFGDEKREETKKKIFHLGNEVGLNGKEKFLLGTNSYGSG